MRVVERRLVVLAVSAVGVGAARSRASASVPPVPGRGRSPDGGAGGRPPGPPSSLEAPRTRSAKLGSASRFSRISPWSCAITTDDDDPLPDPSGSRLDGRLHLGHLAAEQHVALPAEVVGQPQLADRHPRRLDPGVRDPDHRGDGHGLHDAERLPVVLAATHAADRRDHVGVHVRQEQLVGNTADLPTRGEGFLHVRREPADQHQILARGARFPPGAPRAASAWPSRRRPRCRARSTRTRAARWRGSTRPASH